MVKDRRRDLFLTARGTGAAPGRRGGANRGGGRNQGDAPGTRPDLQGVAVDIALRTNDSGGVVLTDHDIGDEGDPA